jgi:hypothetical protein
MDKGSRSSYGAESREHRDAFLFSTVTRYALSSYILFGTAAVTLGIMPKTSPHQAVS